MEKIFLEREELEELIKRAKAQALADYRAIINERIKQGIRYARLKKKLNA